MTQNNIFGLTQKQLAQNLSVSEATIKNWIKLGYLEKVDGYISFASIAKLQKIIGTEKLTKRANKLRKDNFDYEKVASLFLEKLNKGIDISKEYEENLSESYKNKEGIFYTDESIVKDLLDIEGDGTFCDPCCGSGNFIIEAIKQGISPENVYGFDTDKVAVEITKQRIFELTGYKSENIKHQDFLTTKTQKFDYIFTNPPWGKKLPKKYKETIAKQYNIQESLDSASLFFFKSLESLNEGGVLGFLLPEAFFNVATFKEARLKALEYKIKRIVDYKKPFKKLITRAQGIVLQKTTPQKLVTCQWEGKEYKRTIDSFKKNPKFIFNLYCDNKDSDIIEYLYTIEHITLKDRAKWALGIVTGNNKKFITNTPKEGYIPIYKGKHITKEGILDTDEYISKDLSLYQQVAPKKMYETKKLVYKFISSKLCFAYDDKNRYFLNSANILITDVVKMEVLKDLFNSDFMNWLFKKIFNTHKVLRTDLESLPIYTQFLGQKFNEEEYLYNLGIKKQGDTYIKRS